MQLHFFISRKAPARKRLSAILQPFFKNLAVIQYHSIEAIGAVIPSRYPELMVAVIMTADKSELARLAEMKFFKDRFKVLVTFKEPC